MCNVRTCESKVFRGGRATDNGSSPYLGDASKCPLCGELVRPEKRLKTRIGRFPISIGNCRKCRLAVQSPQVTPELSGEYMNWRWASTDPDDRYVTDSQEKSRKSIQDLEWLSQFSFPVRSVLDVGAGSGAFCAAAESAGWEEATGIEISTRAIKRAKDTYGVTLVNQDISSMPDAPTFGLVTMWDVIEHLRNPLQALQQAYARLVPGGMILVETGNYECMARLAEGRHWDLYLLDHMFYFTPNSLKSIIERAGFKNFVLHRRAPRASAGFEPKKSVKALSKKITRIVGNPRLVSRIPHKLFKIARTPFAKRRAMRLWPDHWNISFLLATGEK